MFFQSALWLAVQSRSLRIWSGESGDPLEPTVTLLVGPMAPSTYGQRLLGTFKTLRGRLISSHLFC